MPRHLYLCRGCGARVVGVVERGHGRSCGICATPLHPHRDRVVAVGPAADRRPGDPARARARDRDDARTEDDAGPDDYRTSHPGNPLGRGMPPGRTLRRDEEAHREAWMRVVRSDPCSYCGAMPFPCRHHEEASLDHVDPRSGPRPPLGLHNWTNYSSACQRCNSAKADERLLVWLARRRVLR